MKKLPFLYPILDIKSESELDSAFAYAKRLLAEDIKILQLRAKNVSESSLISFTKEVLGLRDSLSKDCFLIVNDFIGVAERTAAHGVHLGQGDESPELARRVLGDGAIVGLSTHTLEQAKASNKEVLNYIGVGPMFHSVTKSGHAKEVGCEKLLIICREVLLPVVAIGGVTAQRAEAVYAAGASSVAVISELAAADNLSLKIAEFEKAYRKSL